MATQLLEQFSRLNVSPLAQDLEIILQCYYTQQPQLPLHMLQITKNTYVSPQKLYNAIVEMLASKQLSHLLLDVMPLIDDYLEYYSSI